jgi:glycosyltransferase involved in cell wall biosynthesis
MKIGYIMQEGVPDIRKTPPSGAANHVIQVVKELKKAGHQVCLLTKLDQKILKSVDFENFYPVDVKHLERGPARLVEKAIRRTQQELNLAYANLFESFRFSTACQLELSDCDLFFERMGWLGYGAGLAANKLNIPLVLEVNGDHLDEFASQGLTIHPNQYRLSMYLMKKAAQRVQHVVATGEGWKQKYLQRWGIEPANVSVIENGSSLVDILKRSDLKSFAPDEENQNLVRVVYCGGLEPWHGIPILIKAARKAIDQENKIHVTIAGSGSQENKIRDLIQNYELDQHFTIAGQVSIEKLASILSRCDIGVSPYCGRVEYSGLKLLDYKASGLATIASGTMDQPAILKHGHTGWIVPPCDEQELASALVYLATNHHLRKKIGQNARLEAENFHSWKYTANQLTKIFESAIANYSN